MNEQRAMRVPTALEAENASKEQLARWYRFAIATTPQEKKTLDRIAERFEAMGGMTPELSKKIGHGGV